MVKLLSIRKKKDKHAEEFQENLIYADHAKGPTMEDYHKWLGASLHSIIDSKVVELLEDKDMEDLYPALSHLNRLTKIGKEDVVLDRLDLQFIFLRKKCVTNEADYEEKQGSLLRSLEFFANHIPSDAFEGFKAEIQAYQVKVLKTQIEEKKKRG